MMAMNETEKKDYKTLCKKTTLSLSSDLYSAEKTHLLNSDGMDLTDTNGGKCPPQPRAVTFGQALHAVLKGVLKNRKMIKRKDLMKVLFVVVCVWHVCPAHPCGDNPMKVVDNFSRNRGVESATMLMYMRINTPSDYSSLMRDYRRYLDCTQMVQNGYFKRSVDAVQIKMPQTFASNAPNDAPNDAPWSLEADIIRRQLDPNLEDTEAAPNTQDEMRIVSNVLLSLIKRDLNDVDGVELADNWSPFGGRKRRR